MKFKHIKDHALLYKAMAVVMMSVAILSITSLAHAGLWTTVSGMNMKTIEPEAVYAVEAAGNNLRVYEWTPSGNSEIRCMFVSGEAKGGAIHCYPLNN